MEIKRAEPRAHLSSNGVDSKIDGPEWGLMPAPIANGQSRLLGDTSMPPQPFHGWTAPSSTFNQASSLTQIKFHFRKQPDINFL